jgi:hypothetical protein
MRWTTKDKIKEGTRRERSGFLLFPKKLWNISLQKSETRWLEKARWEEEFLGYGEVNPQMEYWVAGNWIEEKIISKE